MTVNRKLALALGIVVIVVAGGTAISQHIQSLRYSSVATSGSTAISSTSTSDMYTLEDVAQHANGTSCWSAINGGVYDLTSWINRHPGGPQAILSICGKDGSAAFNGQHSGQSRPVNELAGFKIGVLASP